MERTVALRRAVEYLTQIDDVYLMDVLRILVVYAARK